MRDLEYPKLELLIVKRGKVKGSTSTNKDGSLGPGDEVLAYMDGTEGCLPCLTIRLD
jgi:hypothetical protein